jgi:hypothetical protein
MHIGKTASAILALALAATSPMSFAAQLYKISKISAALSHNSKLIGSPLIVVKEGVNAIVAVSGSNGYKLALTVTDAGKGQFKIVTHLDTAYGSITPEMVVLAGRPAAVSVGNIAIGLTAVRSGS